MWEYGFGMETEVWCHRPCWPASVQPLAAAMWWQPPGMFPQDWYPSTCTPSRYDCEQADAQWKLISDALNDVESQLCDGYYGDAKWSKVRTALTTAKEHLAIGDVRDWRGLRFAEAGAFMTLWLYKTIHKPNSAVKKVLEPIEKKLLDRFTYRCHMHVASMVPKNAEETRSIYTDFCKHQLTSPGIGDSSTLEWTGELRSRVLLAYRTNYPPSAEEGCSDSLFKSASLSKAIRKDQPINIHTGLPARKPRVSKYTNRSLSPTQGSSATTSDSEQSLPKQVRYLSPQMTPMDFLGGPEQNNFAPTNDSGRSPPMQIQCLSTRISPLESLEEPVHGSLQ